MKKELDVAGMAARAKALLRELSSLRLYREVVNSVRMDMCGYSKEKDAPTVRAITEGERVMLLRLKDIVSSRVPISPSVALAIAAEVLPRYLKDMPHMQVSLFHLFRSAGLSLGRFRKWARARGIRLRVTHHSYSTPASRMSRNLRKKGGKHN